MVPRIAANQLQNFIADDSPGTQLIENHILARGIEIWLIHTQINPAELMSESTPNEPISPTRFVGYHEAFFSWKNRCILSHRLATPCLHQDPTR